VTHLLLRELVQGEGVVVQRLVVDVHDAVLGVVRDPDGLVGVLDDDDRGQRPEDLLAERRKSS
jgi:hypothetical protein